MKVLFLVTMLNLALIAAVVHMSQVEPSKAPEETSKPAPFLKGKRTLIASSFYPFSEGF